MYKEEEIGTKVLENGDIRIVIPLIPYTKKNSQEIHVIKRRKDGRAIPKITPSSNYKNYARAASWYIKERNIDYPVNVKALYYMPTHRIVDITNLHEALHDILVSCRMLVDDNVNIIASTDGSRVFYDKENPRTEVIISKTEASFNV